MDDSLFKTGIRPAVDAYLKDKSEERRDYKEYWSASSAGYCMRKIIFERLGVPPVKEDARKTRVFESGHIFHEWMQRITVANGLSIAQELELQDEDLMIRGHIDDLVLVKHTAVVSRSDVPMTAENPSMLTEQEFDHLILYDYKTQNSRAFSYKRPAMSHYHRMQLGTYMYMLRTMKGAYSKLVESGVDSQTADSIVSSKDGVYKLEEARILKISKDDLRMSEEQLLWTPKLEKDIVDFWSTLNGYWKAKTIPKCTCADYEGGFMGREAYNPFFFDGEPCSLKYLKQWKETNGTANITTSV